MGGRMWPLLGVPVLVVALVLGGAATASASSFVWSGEAAKGSPGWSLSGNWAGGVAPSAGGTVSLEFPRLTGPACAAPVSGTCYVSKDNVPALTAEALRIDDGDEYVLGEGEPLTIGAGGLLASPATGTSGAGGVRDAGAAWWVRRRGGSPAGNAA